MNMSLQITFVAQKGDALALIHLCGAIQERHTRIGICDPTNVLSLTAHGYLVPTTRQLRSFAVGLNTLSNRSLRTGGTFSLDRQAAIHSVHFIAKLHPSVLQDFLLNSRDFSGRLWRWITYASQVIPTLVEGSREENVFLVTVHRAFDCIIAVGQSETVAFTGWLSVVRSLFRVWLCTENPIVFSWTSASIFTALGLVKKCFGDAVDIPDSISAIVNDIGSNPRAVMQIALRHLHNYPSLQHIYVRFAILFALLDPGAMQTPVDVLAYSSFSQTPFQDAFASLHGIEHVVDELGRTIDVPLPGGIPDAEVMALMRFRDADIRVNVDAAEFGLQLVYLALVRLPGLVPLRCAIRAGLVFFVLFSSYPYVYDQLADDSKMSLRLIIRTLTRTLVIQRDRWDIERALRAAYQVNQEEGCHCLLLRFLAVNAELREEWEGFVSLLHQTVAAQDVFHLRKLEEIVGCANVSNILIFLVVFHLLKLVSQPTCEVQGVQADFKRCSGCYNALYCSKACQKVDWFENGHNAQCMESRRAIGM